jgi:hypothetical protein
MKSNTRLLRFLALFSVIVVAIVSAVYTLRAGSNNKSVLLKILFLGWVLSPFTALVWVELFSKAYLSTAKVRRYFFMLFIALFSAIAYMVKMKLPGSKPAFIFLIVPFVSWILMAVFFLVTRRKSNKPL